MINNVINLANDSADKALDTLAVMLWNVQQSAQKTVNDCIDMRRKLEEGIYNSYPDVNKVAKKLKKISKDSVGQVSILLGERLSSYLEFIAQEIRESEHFCKGFLASISLHIASEIGQVLEELENILDSKEKK